MIAPRRAAITLRRRAVQLDSQDARTAVHESIERYAI